jgi:predicted N-acetyltransferase YhbS
MHTRVPLAAGLKVVYKNGVGPSIRFKNADDDATEEVQRLETWRAEDLRDYLVEKLREKKKPELAAAAAADEASVGLYKFNPVDP